MNNTEGLSLETEFMVNCMGWIDDDGYLTTYEFFGIKKKIFNKFKTFN